MTKREFEPAALLDGNIDSVTAVLGDHDDTQLGTLLDAEKAGKNRAGLIEAIGREQATRKGDAEAAATKTEEEAAAKAKADADAALRDGPSQGSVPPQGDRGSQERSYTQAEVDAIHAEHATALAKARQADQDAIGALTSELAKARQADQDAIGALTSELTEARKALSAKASRPPRAVKADAPRKLALLGKSSGAGLRVAFGDENDMSIPQLAELDFGTGEFEKVPGGDGVTLNRPIDFGEGTPGARIGAVWLVDAKGEAHAVSRMVQPLAVGGGIVAQIPAKHLNFTGGKVPVATGA